MKEIYLKIINAFLAIPLVNSSIDNVDELDEEILDRLITNQVIPQTVHFYGYSMENNRNYLDVIQSIIDEIKKSPTHLKQLHETIESLNPKN